MNELDRLDDLIDEWHTSSKSIPLHTYLGMSFEEYGVFVKNPHLYLRQKMEKRALARVLTNIGLGLFFFLISFFQTDGSQLILRIVSVGLIALGFLWGIEYHRVGQFEAQLLKIRHKK